MSGVDERDDPSLENPLTEDSTRDAAAEQPITFDQLDQALAEIQNVLEPEINEFYEKAWIRGGRENHLFDTPDGVFFAFSPIGLKTEEPVSKLDLDADIFKAVVQAHQNEAAVWGFDVDRPTSYAKTLVDDYYPFYIEYPENWEQAQYHARLRMKRLLKHDLTPTEALDYWALEEGPASLSSNRQRDRWHAVRGVDREAVNKTLRQARDKLGDPENQPYYEEQNIETREVE